MGSALIRIEKERNNLREIKIAKNIQSYRLIK
jgi:hypothetical protein